MKALRWLAMVAVTGLLAGCAADPGKDWGGDDPLDGFQGVKPQIHGEVGMRVQSEL